jgi:tetratricopeptide (TPR) repeat protein
MAGMSKPKGNAEAFIPKGKAPGRHQLDFEIDFFGAILARYPDYVDALRVFGGLLTRRGLVKDGLEIDRRLIRLRPRDPIAHYNLACSLSLLGKPDQAFLALRKALELGYSDFSFMRRDRDLDGLKADPRFTKLLREYGVR